VKSIGGGTAIGSLLLVLGALAGCGGSGSDQTSMGFDPCPGITSPVELNGCSEADFKKHCARSDRSPVEYRACAEFESGVSTSDSTPKPTPATSSEEELGGPLTDVGTISVSNNSTAFRDHFKIGPLVYPNEGTPPEEVLEACNLQYQGVVEKSAFARGEMSVSYAEGSFPEFFGIETEGIVQGTGAGANVVAYELNGEWLCRQEELESTSYEIQHGETWNMPIWFIAEDILNNAQPRVLTEVKNDWHFKYVGPNMTGTWKYNGPGAGECAGYEELYLYNRSGYGYC